MIGPTQSISQRRLLVFALLILSVMFLFVRVFFKQGMTLKKNRETKILLGTFVNVDICSARGQEKRLAKAYEAVWRRLQTLHDEMNYYEEKSELSRLNSSAGRPLTVSEDVYRAIHQSLKYNQRTKGAFDITVGPLVSLWEKSAAHNSLPESAELKQTLKLIGSKNIQLLGNRTVRIRNQQVRIDLGAIGQGFAADEAAEVLRHYGFQQFFIDIGGDIYVGGTNCNGQKWRIGIRDPRDKERLVGIIELVDAGVTTSGDYEKFYEIQGQKYSHIINPKTGLPQKDIISATVIAPNATEADVYATALCVLPKELGLGFINSLGGKYAGLVISQINDNLEFSESQFYSLHKLRY